MTRKKLRKKYQTTGVKPPILGGFDPNAIDIKTPSVSKKLEELSKIPVSDIPSDITPKHLKKQTQKLGGVKKKKALKKATATYKSGGFLEPPIEKI
jgi:hypothetical protein